MRDHPTGFNESRGPRVARGAPRGGRGGFRGDGNFRGNRGGNRGDYGNRNQGDRRAADEGQE